MKLTKNFKIWLPFDKSPTENVQGESWTAYGNATVGSSNSFYKNSLQLDGSSYIQSGEIELGGQDFTVDGWCYTDPNCVGGARVFNIHLPPDTGNPLVHLRHPYDSSKWRLVSNTYAGVSNNVNVLDSGVDPTGNLHHFAVVYQYAEKIMTFYVDGVQKARRTNCTQYRRQKFIVDVGTQFFSSTESYSFTGTVDEFRIYDGVALWKNNFTPPNIDEYKNIEIDFEFDAERKIKNPLLSWRYDNYGSADFLTVSGTTLSNLPKNKSVFGSAFYQTSRQKCFDIAATKEIWIKFDVFTTLANRWRAYNENSNGSNGICSQTDGRLSFWVNNENAKEISNSVKNRLQSYLLHMKSDSAKGILEVWQDGEKIYSFSGNVNNGENFADIYLQSDGSGTFFSNIIISNGEIDLNEIASLVGVLWTWNFDTERNINNRILNAKMNTATKVLLHFDDDSAPYTDDCQNSWTAENNPVVSSTNAKFNKALQLDNENQSLTLDGKITLGGKDFAVAGWIYVPASESIHDSYRPARVFFSIGYLLNLRLSTHVSNLDLVALAAWINTKSNANSDLSGYMLRSGLDIGGRLLHFELDYEYSKKTMTFYIDGKEIVKRTDCPQYERKAFSVKIGNFIGSIDDFRIVDGYMLHSKNFIPPTAPYNISEKWIEFSADVERRIFNKITKNFDVERRIFNKIEKNFDLERILTYKAGLQEFYFDLERKLFAKVEIYFDTEIKFPHYITDFSEKFQEIEIEIASQQLTDRLTFTGTFPMNILEQVRGQYLDYFFDMRIEEITRRGILKTYQCCNDIDEILYTQLDYEIGEDYVGYAPDFDAKEIRRAIHNAGGSWSDGDKIIDEEEIIKKAYASSHLMMIAQAIGKNLVMRFDDFISNMEIEQKNITYADLLSNLFGWTSRLPQMKINCYLRDDKLFAIQRGKETRVVDLTNTEHTIPVINETLMRTTWGSSADSTYTINMHHGGHYLRPPPRAVSDDGRTTYHYRRIHPHGYLLEGSTTNNDDGSYETVSYLYSHTLPYELLTEVHEKYEKVYVTQDDGYEAYSGVECVDRTVTHHTPLTPSQRHTQTFDEDGNEMAGVIGSHVAGFYDEVITLWEPYDKQKELTIEGNPLIDMNFPVVDAEKLEELTAAIKWLNRKIQETISFDLFDYPHVIDFNDKIYFNGNAYFLESNTVSKNARIVNKQSLSFVRWYGDE